MISVTFAVGFVFGMVSYPLLVWAVTEDLRDAEEGAKEEDA